MKVPALFLSLFFLLPFLSIGQDASTAKRPVYSVTQIKEDLQLFRKHLESMQPGLYQYYPKDSLDYHFDQINESIQGPMSDLDFYRQLLTLIPYIANGHNQIFPPESYIASMGKKLPRFPFDLYYDEGNLYILRNLSTDEQVLPGTIIRKINGKSSTEIIQYLADRISRDGYNETLPINSAYRSFKTYYAFFIGTPASYQLELEDSQGEVKNVSVDARLLTEITKARKTRYPNLEKPWTQTKDPLYTLEIKDKIATMTLRSFATSYIRKRGQKFKKFFAESFAEIAALGVEELIIDLRSNGGGDPEPTAALFAYLHDQPVPFYTDMKLLINKIPDPKYYDTNARMVNLIAWTIVKKNGKEYQARSMKKINKPWKVKNRFSGPVYVLTNPSSFSATGEMTGIIKGYDRATFIGEEAGGNPITNTSGSMLPLILPNTQIKAIIPIVQFVMAVDLDNDGHGVPPDHVVRNSIEDELKGRDAAMEYTLELIRKK